MEKFKGEHQILERGADQIWLRRQEANQALRTYQHTLLDADICDAINYWLYEAQIRGLLGSETVSNYRRYMKELVGCEIFRLAESYEGVTLVRDLVRLRNLIAHRMECLPNLDLKQQRYRMSALVSFSIFLEQECGGAVQRLEAPPSLALGSVNRHPAPRVLTTVEFQRLGNVIRHISLRDYCVISLVLFTARNLGQVLEMRLGDLDFEKAGFRFTDEQDGTVATVINASPMRFVQAYLEKSQGERKDDLVFVTGHGKPVYRTHYSQLLAKASEKVDLGFVVTLKMIQWAYVAKYLKTGWSVGKVLKHFGLKRIPQYLESSMR